MSTADRPEGFDLGAWVRRVLWISAWTDVHMKAAEEILEALSDPECPGSWAAIEEILARRRSRSGEGRT